MTHTFRIAAPFVTADEIVPLKEAGADELYCGFIDAGSERRWPGSFAVLNRRGRGQNIEGLPALKVAVGKAEKNDLPVYITMNGLYTPEQYPWLLGTIRKISAFTGIRGLIVADMGLLLTLRNRGYKKEIVVSTGGAAFNFQTADFFSSLGASRIVLDRQLATEEMVGLISGRTTGIGIEVFMMNDPCLFVDGYCTFSHSMDSQCIRQDAKGVATVEAYNTTFDLDGCGAIKRALAGKAFRVCRVPGTEKGGDKVGCGSRQGLINCNLCGLYELRRFPEITLKVAGRGVHQARAVRMVAAAVKILGRKNISRDQYREKIAQLYAGVEKRECTARGRCYSRLLDRKA